MTVRSPFVSIEQPTPLEQARSILIGPAVAKALHEDRLPYYSVRIGGPFGLDADGLFCACCGGTFTAPSFAIASSKSHLLYRDDPRVSSQLLVMHRPCVRMAEDWGQTLDEWMTELQATQEARR